MTDVQQLLDSITDLPTLPDVVARVNRTISAPNSSASDITKIIANDMTLSAKILKVVNSPFYGFPRRITNITYAVVILGFRAVRNLALSAFMFDSFRMDSKSSGFDVKAFWDHSIGTAQAASHIAEKVCPDQMDDAFMTGLLHDIGKVVINQYIPEDMKTIVATVRERDCLFLEAESEALDYTHTQIGEQLLERWNLPKHVAGVVRSHHAPAESPEECRTLSQVVHLADILTRAIDCGCGGDEKIPCIDPRCLEELGVDEDDLRGWITRLLAEAQNVSAFYDLA